MTSTAKNYAGQNLRGICFKGQDLSGSDFSGADLRGTNFTGAILRGANFSKAKTGVQKWWLVFQLILAFHSIKLIRNNWCICSIFRIQPQDVFVWIK